MSHKIDDPNQHLKVDQSVIDFDRLPFWKGSTYTTVN